MRVHKFCLFQALTLLSVSYTGHVAFVVLVVVLVKKTKIIKRRCGSEKMIMSQNENATRSKSTTRHSCYRVVRSESPETLVRRSTTTTALLQAAASFLTSSTRRTKCAVFSNEARQRTEKITVPEQCRFCFVWLLCNFVFVLLW